jgi:hypothetical protein
MAKGHRLKPEQILTLLRKIDVLTTNSKTLLFNRRKRELHPFHELGLMLSYLPYAR